MRACVPGSRALGLAAEEPIRSHPEQHINVFGKESIDHITPAQIRALLADPVNAVPHLIKLKYRRAPGGVNNNVRIPNQKRAIYQVVVQGDDGEKQWESQAKGDVLEQLYDDNSGELEAEADEDTREGLLFWIIRIR